MYFFVEQALKHAIQGSEKDVFPHLYFLKPYCVLKKAKNLRNDIPCLAVFQV